MLLHPLGLDDSKLLYSDAEREIKCSRDCSHSVTRFSGSYRSKLLASFFVLGLVVIGATYWQASSAAVAALRQTTYDRLTAIRETKRRAIEDYFQDLNARVLALSTDESTIVALEQFTQAWPRLPVLGQADGRTQELERYYRKVFAPTVANQISPAALLSDWFPRDPRTRALQYVFIASNPRPLGSKDLLLEAKSAGKYGEVHARYHPTFHRYRAAFDIYDVFLIQAGTGRVVYTVSKEIDLGRELTAAPFRGTALAKAFERAMPADAAIVDFEPYMPSHLAPAAFIAAPVRRAGLTSGVLAIQVSINHVNRVMTGGRNWAQEGLGQTGQSYLVAADGTLRSDFRHEMEDPEAFFRQMREAGVSAASIERVRRYGTGVLTLQIPRHSSARGEGTAIARDIRNVEVIRSYAPLNIPGLDWTLFAEIETAEAFAPVSALRRQLLATGLAITVLFLTTAWLLARSVTQPIRALVHGTRRIGGRDFDVRLPVTSSDEIGELAASFNAMTERLEKTTVSRDELDRANRDLQELAARLIRAQEDERSRLARELHDDLTQRVAALAIEVGALKRRAEAPGVRQDLSEVQQKLIQLSDDVHGLSRRLHSATLEEIGLAGAIEGECRGFFERTGTPVDFRSSGDVDQVKGEARVALFRIVQEALRNTYRHAGASEVEIRLERRNGEVLLDIRDNGRGFDRSNPEWRAGLGLASMSERARLMGGRLDVQSQPGEGTSISVSIPA